MNKKFRELYPTGIISLTAEAFLSSMVKLHVTIETGPVEGSPSQKLVDIDSLTQVSNFESAKKHALSEALELAGICSCTEEDLKGKDFIKDLRLVINTKESDADVAPLFVPAEGLPAENCDIDVGKPAPVEEDSSGMDVVGPHSETVDETDVVQELSEEVKQAEPPEENVTFKSRKLKKNNKSAARTRVENIPESRPGETVEETPATEALQPAESDKEEASKNMTLEEAEACVLTVLDEGMKSRMGDFVGKPMKLIATEKPSLLRFMVRKNNGSVPLFTAECMRAAQVLYLSAK